MMTYREKIKELVYRFKNAGIEDAETDARYLVEYVCDIRWSRLIILMEQELEADKERLLEELARKREQRIPLQYIMGRQEFMGLVFNVNPAVLVPRQDTELLVLNAMKECDGARVLDLCTGSGCIAISLAKLGRPEYVLGIDVSEEAVKTAGGNAELNDVKAEFRISDLFENVTGRYDLITANPPYIESEVIEGLMTEVSVYEPRLALDGGNDGLVFYRRIIAEAQNYLYDGGSLFMEIGYNQATAVSNLLKTAGYADINVIEDYGGLDRVVTARWRMSGHF